jgi:hypothetical protein
MAVKNIVCEGMHFMTHVTQVADSCECAHELLLKVQVFWDVTPCERQSYRSCESIANIRNICNYLPVDKV